MPKKVSLNPQQRVEIVLALLRKEESAASLSRRYQVSEQTIYRWRDAFIESGKQGLASSKKSDKDSDRRLRQLERELSKRAQVIGELSLANDILKKLQEYPS